MAGFWHLSHHQMRDPNGRIYANAKAYFTSAETGLPIVVYQNYGLGTAHPNPVAANAYGIFPPVFLDEEDEFYRQRITTSGGVLIPGTDVGTLPIIGPSGGGGGSEVPVDENALLKTGYPLWLPKSGALSGFIRLNGRTFGSATSGASERANADCEPLYLDAWASFSNTICPVTGGRGLTAAADWAANKPMATLDMRGKGPFGLDGMGSSRANVLADTFVTSGDGDTAASSGGEDDHTLITAEIPSHSHGVTDPTHTHVLQGISQINSLAVNSGSGSNANSGSTNGVTNPASTGITINNAGGGGAHNNMPPFMLGTWYWKL